MKLLLPLSIFWTIVLFSKSTPNPCCQNTATKTPPIPVPLDLSTLPGCQNINGTAGMLTCLSEAACAKGRPLTTAETLNLFKNLFAGGFAGCTYSDASAQPAGDDKPRCIFDIVLPNGKRLSCGVFGVSNDRFECVEVQSKSGSSDCGQQPVDIDLPDICKAGASETFQNNANSSCKTCHSYDPATHCLDFPKNRQCPAKAPQGDKKVDYLVDNDLCTEMARVMNVQMGIVINPNSTPDEKKDAQAAYDTAYAVYQQNCIGPPPELR